jgi:autotransporter translocation and assembly factor TamB
VTARFNLEGTVGAPRVGAVGVVHDVRAAKTVQIDSLAFTARYADGDLEVQRFAAGAAGALLQAAGHVPLDLHLGRGVHLRREDGVAARVQLPKGSSFAVVTHFISFFVPPPAGLPLGTVAANLEVTGTAGAPKLRGDFRVDGASFMLKDMEEVYHDVHAVGLFEGEKLRLTELRGKSGPEGWVQGKGESWVAIKGLRVTDYQIGVDAAKVPVFSIPEMAALVSGHLDIRGVDVGLPQPVPELRGSLQILEATITKDFESDSQTADLIESTDRPEWLADLNLQATGRVWVRNSNADAELAGNVQLVRTKAGMDVKGLATVRRGYYGVYLERFEITRGELDFSRYPGFEPSLDIEGRRGRPSQRIYVHLTGRPSEPHLAFNSDQGGTSEELQQELLTALHNDPGAAASSAFSQLLANFEYLDSISIDPASSSGSSTTTSNEKSSTTSLLQPYNVSAGLAITDRVFMTYTYGFNRSDLNQRVALELDVLRGVLLSSAWEQRSVPSRQETTDSAQNAFQLDLKFRYER